MANDDDLTTKTMARYDELPNEGVNVDELHTLAVQDAEVDALHKKAENRGLAGILSRLGIAPKAGAIER